MKNDLKIIGILTAVCMLCGFLLAFVYSAARDRIEENEKKYIYQAIEMIVPGVSAVSEMMIEGRTIYKLSGEDGSDTGLAFLCEGQGYQGKIKILCAVDCRLREILGIEIIESNETPGLGAKINEKFFKQRFAGVPADGGLECVKFTAQNSSQIEAITSATVSSKAVVKTVNQGIEDLKKMIGHE